MKRKIQLTRKEVLLLNPGVTQGTILLPTRSRFLTHLLGTNLLKPFDPTSISTNRRCSDMSEIYTITCDTKGSRSSTFYVVQNSYKLLL